MNLSCSPQNHALAAASSGDLSDQAEDVLVHIFSLLELADIQSLRAVSQVSLLNVKPDPDPVRGSRSTDVSTL